MHAKSGNFNTKNDTKNSAVNNALSPHKCNFIDKATCLFKEKCPYKCIVHKVEVYSLDLTKLTFVVMIKSKCKFYTRT